MSIQKVLLKETESSLRKALSSQNSECAKNHQSIILTNRQICKIAVSICDTYNKVEKVNNTYCDYLLEHRRQKWEGMARI